MFRRHEPAPFAAVACFTTLVFTATSQLKVSLCRHRNSHSSHFINPPPPTSLSRFGFMDFFFCYYVLSLHFLSLMTPNWCVSHVWEQVKCVARWLCSHKSHIFTALPVDSFNHHKNKKIRHLGLKCVEESRLTYLCLLFNYTY